jgi:ubiquitin-protein ligase
VYGTDRPIIRGRILPEKDPYCFASFLIEIRVPFDYPFKRPEIIILDPIYHPNVKNDGRHRCCRGPPGEWSPAIQLTDCIKAVINTINDPAPEHRTNPMIASEYLTNYEKFYEKASEYTFKYGRPRC